MIYYVIISELTRNFCSERFEIWQPNVVVVTVVIVVMFITASPEYLINASVSPIFQCMLPVCTMARSPLWRRMYLLYDVIFSHNVPNGGAYATAVASLRCRIGLRW